MDESVRTQARRAGRLLRVPKHSRVAQNFRIHHKEFGEAMVAGEQEQERRDYPAAFDSFKHAAELGFRFVAKLLPGCQCHPSTFTLTACHGMQFDYECTVVA
jgi:hypothetical protein